MIQEEYLSQRVDQDFKWYDNRAKLYRLLHIGSRVLIIVISASITILSSVTLYGKDLLIAILSTIVVVVTSISELMKFKEQWFEYRTTAEAIKSEKIFFQTNTEPYNTKDNFNLFVKNYESIVKSENQKWRTYISDKS